MVKIILSGCNGRMGKVISKLANTIEDVSIVAGIDRNTKNPTIQFLHPYQIVIYPQM